MKATLIMCFNQSENIKNIQNSLGKDSDWIIDSVIIMLLVFQSIILGGLKQLHKIT